MKPFLSSLRRGLDAYFVLLLAFFVGCLPYVVAHSESSVWTLARGVDEFEFYRNIDQLLYATWGNYKHLDALVGFAYGGSYWLLCAASAFPFWRLGEEQVVLVILRLVSLFSALGAFYLVSRILKRFQVPLWIGLLSIAACFLSAIQVSTATVIHPETLYALGLVFSFYCLVRDEGRLGRWLTFSILAYAFAVSVKLLALPFGVVFLIYLWAYRSRFRTGLWVSLPVTGLFGIGLFHAYLLLPGLARTYFERIAYQSDVLKAGWVPEESQALALVERFSMFSASYLHAIAFLILLAACIVFLSLLWKTWEPGRLHRDVTGLMAAVLMGGYFIFCIFVAKVPSNYGIFILFVLPIVLGLLSCRLPKSGGVVLVACVLLGFALPVSRGLQHLALPEGGERAQRILTGLEQIERFMKGYQGRFRRIGVSHDYGIPHLNGETVNFVRLWAFDTESLPQFNLIILLENDSFADLYKGINRPDHPTALAYRALCDGRAIPFKDGHVRFSRIHTEAGMEVFERSAIE